MPNESDNQGIPLKGIILDLDDTLYLESEYVVSGFQAVGRALSNDSAQAVQYADWFIACAAKSNDGQTFNHFLDTFTDLRSTFSVGDLIKAYRDHLPSLSLSERWRELIRDWRSEGLFLGLISDGVLSGQQRKVEALGLVLLLDSIILTDTYGKAFWKPHERSFRVQEQASRLSGAQLVYIGDNVLKDFVAPNALGWRTIRLKQAGQLREHLVPVSQHYAAQEEVNDLSQLRNLLAVWADGGSLS